MNTALKKEPAVSIGGTVSLVLFATLGILKSYGVVIPDDVAGHVETLLYVIAGIPAVSGFLTRFFVSSPNTVERETGKAYVEGLQDRNIPDIA